MRFELGRKTSPTFSPAVTWDCQEKSLIFAVYVEQYWQRASGKGWEPSVPHSDEVQFWQINVNTKHLTGMNQGECQLKGSNSPRKAKGGYNKWKCRYLFTYCSISSISAKRFLGNTTNPFIHPSPITTFPELNISSSPYTSLVVYLCKINPAVISRINKCSKLALYIYYSETNNTSTWGIVLSMFNSLFCSN